MSDERQQHDIWVGLAQELIHRPDVRPDIAQNLQRALETTDERQRSKSIQTVLSLAVSQFGQDSQTSARRPEGAPRRLFSQDPKAVLKRVRHGLGRVADRSQPPSPRLCTFLRDQLLTYAQAYQQASPSENLESVESIAQEILSGVAEKNVPARRARVGIVTPDEVAAIASGTLHPKDAPTVLATGDPTQDTLRWKNDPAIPQARRDAIASGQFDDGQYLFAIIEPTEEGQRVEVHPISKTGQPAYEAVASFSAPSQSEPLPVATVLIEPAIVSGDAPTPSPLPTLVEAPAAGQAGFIKLREIAVGLNQARVALYTEILKNRTDLKGTARAAAERKLERMQSESVSLAQLEANPNQLATFISKWSKEISRDRTRLAARTRPGTVEEGVGARLGALSRMGALEQRLSQLATTARGETPRVGHYFAGQSFVLAAPPSDDVSIFDDLAGGSSLPRSVGPDTQPAAGEGLSSDVVLRDTSRAVPPSASTKRSLQAIAEGGQRLQRALSTMSGFGRTGLQVSSSLRPLLRPEGMPSVIRAKTDSPLMRGVFLPAMERVSGPQRALARVETSSGGTPAQLTAEQLYATLLGEAGAELIERRPAVARNILRQMGRLGQRLGQAGRPPALEALSQAGEEIRERVTSIASSTAVDAPAGELAQPTQTEVLADTIGPAVGVDPEPATGADTTAAGVDDVAGALQEEGSTLSSALRERISPFVDVSQGQRVFSGPTTTAALGEMGARAATVGQDVYVREDHAQDPATIGHELSHVAQGPGGSVETQEEQAYQVESEIRSSFQLGELAQEDPGTPEVASDPGKEEEKSGKTDVLFAELVKTVSDIWADELEFRRWRG